MNLRSAISELFSTPAPTQLRLETRASLENPTTPLNSPAAFNMVFGGEPTASGEVVTERNALEITTVYACVRLIAESIGSLPLRVWEQKGNSKIEATSHSLSYLLGVQPNPEMSAVTFFETLVGCCALTGNAYAEIERDSKGNVIGLYPLHPLKTEPVRDSRSQLVYVTSDGMENNQTRTLAASDIIHVPLFSWDGLKGLSPVALARHELGLSQAQLKQGARFFGNGSRPGGILAPKVPIDTKNVIQVQQVQQMREFWEKQASGVNQGRIAILPADWSYQALGMSLEDSQFLESRGYTRNQIAALFRVSPMFLGDQTRLSNSNHENTALSLIQDTLNPYISKFTAELCRKLLPRTGTVASKYQLRFDLTERLRTDIKTTIDSLAVGRQWGAYSANDMRQILGMNPIGPEGDIYLAPVNMLDANKFKDWTPQAKAAELPKETPNEQ